MFIERRLSMLIAKDERENLTYADQAKKETLYFCPACCKKVFLKRGTYIAAHFAHYANNNCTSFSEGETLEHLEGKKILYNWFRACNLPVELEPYLKELNQRPDLLIKKGKRRISIEFQCSPLKESDFIERTEGYLSKDIEVIWILGSPFFKSKKIINTQTRKFIRNQKSMLFLLSLDTATSSINIWNQFSSLHRRMTYKKTTFRLDNVNPHNLSHILSTEETNKLFNFQYVKEDHKKLTKKRYDTRSSFFQNLYSLQESLISLPLEVYVRLKDDWLITEGDKSILWKLIFLKYIENMGTSSILTFNKIEDIIETMSFRNEIQWLPTPLLSEKIKFRPILQFIKVLEETGCLQPIGHEEWLIKQKARRFEREEDKLKIL